MQHTRDISRVREIATWLWLQLLFFAAVSTAGGPIVVSEPELEQAPMAPLVYELSLTTEDPSRISVWASDGTESWTRDFPAYRLDHSVPLAPFKADTIYEIRVTLYDAEGVSAEWPDSLFVTTDALPAIFPDVEILVSEPENMEPGFTLFSVRNLDSLTDSRTLILDADGDVVWYTPVWFFDARQLPNGHFMYMRGNNSLYETNLSGESVRVWAATLSPNPTPAGAIPVETISFHHEAFPTEHGTILILSEEARTIEDYPSSETDPDAPPADAEVTGDLILEFDPTTGTILHEWSLFDILDPLRIGYNSLDVFPNGTFDWTHGNALIHDPSDDSVIVSARHQDALIKVRRTTGELVWIFGTHANWSPAFQPFLFDPVGPSFEWQYHQHAPMLTPSGSLLFFDNGNNRASPFVEPPVADENNYSRAVEVSINEETMQVSQLWEYGSDTPERLFARAVSDADWLPSTQNILVTFGLTTFVDSVALDAPEARILEIARGEPDEKVFEIAVRGGIPDTAGVLVYRSERIADLYPSPITVALDADVTSPAEWPDLDLVTFTADASGGSTVYEYRFLIENPADETVVVQDYSGDNSFVWAPTSEGLWKVEVQVRNLGSTALWEASDRFFFEILTLFSDGFESGDVSAWSSSN